MVAAVNVRKIALLVIALQCLSFTSSSQSYGATAKPKPKVAVSKKTIQKKTIQKKSVSKTKPTSKNLFSKKVAAKKVPAKKKVTVVKKRTTAPRYVYHRHVPPKIEPSPAAKWPPVGFTSIGTAYARVPTGMELVGILSAMKNPTASINSCAQDPKNPSAAAYSCAAILVGSTDRCTWWRITSTITGIDPADPSARVTLGTITTYDNGAAAKTIQTIFMISPIPLQTGVRFTDIHALCGIGPSTSPVPSTSFEPFAPQSESPSPEPSPSNS